MFAVLRTDEVTTHSMATSSSTALAARCFWTEADEAALISVLLEHQAEAGDGGNFKKAVWSIAADHLKTSTTKGVEKTGLACKNKWTSVCPFSFCPLILLMSL